MQAESVSLDQAPPLSIPAGFFLTAPFALIVAGLVLVSRGTAVLSSGWDPGTLALTHLGTLGFLGMVMVGALYQMTPVVAGARVPLIRTAHVVHASLLIAVIALTWAGLRVAPMGFAHGFRLAGFALVLFLLPVGWALLRTPARTDTVQGMRLALFSLLLVGTMGLVMAETLAGRSLALDRGLMIRVHLGLALLCWVGGLLTAVSWQVVPMFYLCDEPARRSRRFILASVGLSALLLPACLFVPPGGSVLPRDLALLAAAPAALAVWIVHPWTTLRAMNTRKRRRPDASLSSWQAGLCFGPLTLVFGVAAHLSHDPRYGLAFVWLAVWGWAGLIVHGMLHRIVPFLAWFHDLSFLVGKAPVPSTRGLLPDARTRLGLRLHLVSVVAGAAAILTRWDPLAWLAGVAMIATAANMLRCFAGALLRSRRVAAAAAQSPAD